MGLVDIEESWQDEQIKARKRLIAHLADMNGELPMNWLLIAQLIQQLLPVAIQAVETVEKATGKAPPEAVQEVIEHLTPGAPNSPALNATKPTS
jgi:hypothetical protein